jgi:hypothetical protein
MNRPNMISFSIDPVVAVIESEATEAVDVFTP